MTIAYLGFAGMLALMALGVPIAIAMTAAGVIGLIAVGTLGSALTQLTLVVWSEGSNFILLALPFYILMGNLILQTGIARRLFHGASIWLNWLPGGLAIASVFACAGFGAVSGSSTATARTMGAIIVPELRRYRYNMSLGTGVLSASGTLGILIPPSIIMIFYGLMTETSIGALFIAGIVPGIIVSMIFASIILIIALIRPEAVGTRLKREEISWSHRIAALLDVVPVISIFMLILGGLYFGVVTPTESAAVGVLAVLAYGAVIGKLSFRAIRLALIDSMLTTVMILMIIIGGYLFTRFLAQTGLIAGIQAAFVAADLGYVGFIIVVTILYLILGCVLDLFGMMILTVPILFPMALQLGIDPVWFGIFVIIVAEIALVTPPLGVNVFVINSVARDVPLGKIFLGCVPFVVGLLLFVVVLATWPQIALFPLAGLR